MEKPVLHILAEKKNPKGGGRRFRAIEDPDKRKHWGMKHQSIRWGHHLQRLDELGFKRVLAPGDMTGAAMNLEIIRQVLEHKSVMGHDSSTFTDSERSYLCRLKKKWERRVAGEDERWNIIGSAPGRPSRELDQVMGVRRVFSGGVPITRAQWGLIWEVLNSRCEDTIVHEKRRTLRDILDRIGSRGGTAADHGTLDAIKSGVKLRALQEDSDAQ